MKEHNIVTVYIDGTDELMFKTDKDISNFIEEPYLEGRPTENLKQQVMKLTDEYYTQEMIDNMLVEFWDKNNIDFID